MTFRLAITEADREHAIQLLSAPGMEPRIYHSRQIELVASLLAERRELIGYTQHSQACWEDRDHALMHNNPTQRLPCTCGLMDLLEARKA